MIIKSTKHLGDTIHAYYAVKELNKTGKQFKLFTKPTWRVLFDPQYILDTYDASADVLSLDGDISTIVYPVGFSTHARTKITDIFGIGKAYSDGLYIHTVKDQKNLVTLCTRSSKEVKDWNGDWNAIESNLIDLGYQIKRDNHQDSIDVLVKNISSSQFIISVDTACVHIAEAYGIPVIGLYGTTMVSIFGPYTNSQYCIGARYMEDITEADIMKQVAIIMDEYGHPKSNT